MIFYTNFFAALSNKAIGNKTNEKINRKYSESHWNIAHLWVNRYSGGKKSGF